ncbi:MAG: LysR family transcriptional regulator [Firmicutes bacterium]|nr:LysR family transcriptional regulator [Bacillota bacterium]
MRIEVLPYIIMAAEYHSITKAAEEAHLSQTTLSAAIRTIEKELGIVIFVRNSKGVTLSEDGARFVELARKMLDCYQAMEDLSENHSYLSIYINTAMHERFMNDIYSMISRHGVSISTFRFRAGTYFAHDYAAQIHHRLVLDFCDSLYWETTSKDLERRGFEVIPLQTNYMTFYLNKEDPLAGRQSISTKDIKDSSIILTKYSLWYMRQPQAMKILKRGRVVDGSVDLIFDALNEPGTVAFLMDAATVPQKSLHSRDNIVTVPWMERNPENGKEIPRQTFVQYMMYHRDARFTHVERDILREISYLLMDQAE